MADVRHRRNYKESLFLLLVSHAPVVFRYGIRRRSHLALSRIQCIEIIQKNVQTFLIITLGQEAVCIDKHILRLVHEHGVPVCLGYLPVLIPGGSAESELRQKLIKVVVY